MQQILTEKTLSKVQIFIILFYNLLLFAVWLMIVLFSPFFVFFFYSQSGRIYCYYDWRYLALEEKKLTHHKREELLAASIIIFCAFIYFSNWSGAESYLRGDQNKNEWHALIIQ